MNFKDMDKLINDKCKRHKYCEHCGHTMTFYAFEPDRKICSWCGRYNYRNDLVKFKYLLSSEMKKVNN